MSPLYKYSLEAMLLLTLTISEKFRFELRMLFERKTGVPPFSTIFVG